MRLIQEREILNLERFRSDTKNRIVNHNIELTTPFIKDVNVNIRPTSFEQLTNEILKIAKMFPHRKCALTYIIDNKSTISVEVCPVTETA